MYDAINVKHSDEMNKNQFCVYFESYAKDNEDRKKALPKKILDEISFEVNKAFDLFDEDKS